MTPEDYYGESYPMLVAAQAQLDALADEFASQRGDRDDLRPVVYHTPRIKSPERLAEKIAREGGTGTTFADALGMGINDVVGTRIICAFTDDVYAAADWLLARPDVELLVRKDYIANPKPNGYRSLHLVVNVPIVISEGTMVLPVEIQLRTIAMDMWASLEHELRYKSDRKFTQQDAARLRLCSDAISEIDREMQDIYQGNEPKYHA